MALIARWRKMRMVVTFANVHLNALLYFARKEEDAERYKMKMAALLATVAGNIHGKTKEIK